MCLFTVEEIITGITPLSLHGAFGTSTKIIRSNIFKNKLVGLFDDHMDLVKLGELVDKDDLFVVSKIRETEFLNAASISLKSRDPWKIYLNPLLLLEMQDLERE
jgi:hypothetical protein